MAYSSEALPFTLSHVYNDSYSTGHFTSSNANINTVNFASMGMGKGWKLSVQETVVASEIGEDPCYIYNDADGTEHYFYISDGNNGYIDEDGLGLIFNVDSADSSKYVIKDKQDNQKIFINGILYEIIDANDNIVRMVYNGTSGKPPASGAVLNSIIRQNKGTNSAETLAEFTYSSSRLSEITDKYGRNTTFAYDTSGYLTGVTFADGQTVTYTYSSGKLYSAADNESNYKIVYSLVNNTSEGTKTRTVIEYANGNRGNSLYSVNIPGKKTTYTSQTWNGSSAIDEEISTSYCFDYMGRTVTAYSHDDSGKIYGANTTGYVSSGNTKQNNHISSNGIVGTIPQNLLVNGGFEDESAGGWTLSSNVSRQPSPTDTDAPTHTGNSSIRFASETITSTEMYAYQSFQASYGETYTASAYVDVSRVTFGLGGMYLKIVDQSGNLISRGSNLSVNMTSSLSDKWQRISVTFEAPASGTYYVYVGMHNASGEAYVDDILLENNSAPSSYNLIGNKNSWALNNGATITTNNPVNKTAITFDFDDSALSALATKEIPIKKTGYTTYMFSAWAYLETTPGAIGRQIAIKATINYADNSKQTVVAPFNIGVQGEAQFVQGVIIPQKSNVCINSISVQVYFEDHMGTAYIYDVALVEENVRTYTYDSNGNPKSTAQMNTTPISTTYNNENDLISKAQGAEETAYTYAADYPHRVSSMTQAGITISMSYTSGGMLSSTHITNIKNNHYLVSSNSYSGDKNNIIFSENVNEQKTWYTYNNGLVSSIKNHNNVTTYYEYNDANDRPERVFLNSIVDVHYEYTRGMLSSIARTGMIDIATNTQEYTFEYDDFGNTTKIKVGNYTLVTYQYEANNGKLLRTTYGNGNYVENIYDDIDRITGVKINGVTKYTYSYNGDGNIYEIKDLDNNITICYNYDSLKRLVSSQQKISNSVGAYTYYSYDDMGRAYRSDFCLINTMGGTLSQTYTYTYKDTNEDGSNTDASKKADGTLKSINVNYDAIASANETISYNYDNLKRISGKVYSGGLQYNYTYKYLNDARTTYLTDTFTARFNSSTLLSNSYTYDNIGNITKISNGNNTVAEYTYDEQNQLTSEKIFSQNIRYDYWYDTYGNLTSVYKYNLSTGAYIDSNYYSYGSNGYSDENGWHDMLTSFDGGNITYDAIGNPLSYYNGASYTFTWQNGRELASAVKGGVTTTYKYGADGMRVQKKVGNDIYFYYYSEGLLMRQTWGANYIDFLYDESGLPYSFIYNGTQYYYIKNLQNDVIAIANTSGSIVVNYTYDAWGNLLSTTGSMASTVGAVNPIRYRSYYYDGETGFYYLQTRYYDPAIRRFINVDGYLNANGDILGFNMYAYCGNNPVMYSDPTGTSAIGKILTLAWGIATVEPTLVGEVVLGIVAIAFCGTMMAMQDAAAPAISIPNFNIESKEKTEEKSKSKEIILSWTSNAIYYGCRMNENDEMIYLTGPMNYSQAYSWAMEHQTTNKDRWGLYTTRSMDAILMASALGTYAEPVYHDNHAEGYYRHYHTGNYKFINYYKKYKHFHVWFGSPMS